MKFTTWMNRSLLLAFACLMILSQAVLGRSLRINGVALYEELGEPYYYGALSIQTPSDNPGVLLLNLEPRRMELRVAARKISPRRFKKMWNESIATNNKEAVIEAFADDIQHFLKIIKDDLIEGDRMVVQTAGGDSPVLVSINGVDLLQAQDPGFFNLLLRCWIGEVPITREFRQDILGVDSERLALLSARFKGLHTKPGRSEEIETWIAQKVQSPQHRTVQSKPKATNPVTSTPLPVSKSAEPTVQAPSSTEINAKSKEIDISSDQPVSETTVGETEASQTVKKENEKLELEDEQTKEIKSSIGSKITNESEYYYAAVDWASRHSQFPPEAVEQRMEGVVRIRVTVDRFGKVLQKEFLQKTDYAILNQAAEKAIDRSEPFPPIPSVVKGKTYQFTVPFRYQVDAN